MKVSIMEIGLKAFSKKLMHMAALVGLFVMCLGTAVFAQQNVDTVLTNGNRGLEETLMRSVHWISASKPTS